MRKRSFSFCHGHLGNATPLCPTAEPAARPLLFFGVPGGILRRLVITIIPGGGLVNLQQPVGLSPVNPFFGIFILGFCSANA